MWCRWSRAWCYQGVDISNYEDSADFADEDMEDSESCEDVILDSEDQLDNEQLLCDYLRSQTFVKGELQEIHCDWSQ